MFVGVSECQLTYVLSGDLKSSVEFLSLPGICEDVDHDYPPVEMRLIQCAIAQLNGVKLRDKLHPNELVTVFRISKLPATFVVPIQAEVEIKKRGDHCIDKS